MKTTETRRLPGSLYSIYSCIHTCMRIYTDAHIHVRTATEAFSRCEVFASRSKALGFQRVRAAGEKRRWKRKDRAEMQIPRDSRSSKAPQSPCSHHSHTFSSSLFPYFTLTTTIYLFPILDLWHLPFLILSFLVFRVSCHGLASRPLCFPIYLALRLTLGLLEYHPGGYPPVTDCLDLLNIGMFA